MIKQTPPPLIASEQLRPAVRILRALAHPLRLRIIRVIEENNGSANVGEIFATLKIEQSVASQHLRILRQAALVNTRRDRKFVYYSLDYDRIALATSAIGFLEKMDIAPKKNRKNKPPH
ncbi:MAG: ArsR/SmtB family transcription factor [Saprospiraceae bacterium]